MAGDLGAAGVGLGGAELAVFVGDACEHCLKGVVVTERERVELVVVAAGAADREAKEALAGVDEDVVEGILAGEPLRGVVGTDLAGKKDGGGDEEPGGGVVPVGVTGELTANERVVGHVGIEGRHDPVAVGPGVGPFGVDLVAVGVGVADDVEPVLGHPLAVAWRGEEPIDDALVGAGRLVSQEGVDLFGRGREARQIERHAPEPLAAIGFRRRRKPFGLEPGEDEAVEVVAWPALVAHGWGGGADDALEGPVIAPVDEACPVDPFGPQSPGVDPRSEDRHFVRGKPRHVRIGRRHLHLRLIATREAHQHALRRLPRHDRRAMAVAAAKGLGADVEPQPALRLLARVAAAAGAVEEGADVADEVGGVGAKG